jgi:hypothetical protein
MVIVRAHPKRAGCFEIINGYHRVEALKKLGRQTCDCVVWQVDDTEALLLVATLNRLGGRDDLDKKSGLIKSLSERFSTKELAESLGETKGAIERLKDLHRPLQRRATGKKVFLNPLMFFISDEQKKTVDEALAKVVGPNQAGTAAQKRAGAIMKIAEAYLAKG